MKEYRKRTKSRIGAGSLAMLLLAGAGTGYIAMKGCERVQIASEAVELKRKLRGETSRKNQKIPKHVETAFFLVASSITQAYNCLTGDCKSYIETILPQHPGIRETRTSPMRARNYEQESEDILRAFNEMGRNHVPLEWKEKEFEKIRNALRNDEELADYVIDRLAFYDPYIEGYKPLAESIATGRPMNDEERRQVALNMIAHSISSHPGVQAVKILSGRYGSDAGASESLSSSRQRYQMYKLDEQRSIPGPPETLPPGYREPRVRSEPKVWKGDRGENIYQGGDGFMRDSSGNVVGMNGVVWEKKD